MGLLSWISGGNEEEGSVTVTCRYTRDEDESAVDVYATINGGKERGPLSQPSIDRLYATTEHKEWKDGPSFTNETQERTQRRGWFW